jgi:hypothetical protein
VAFEVAVPVLGSLLRLIEKSSLTIDGGLPWRGGPQKEKVEDPT